MAVLFTHVEAIAWRLEDAAHDQRLVDVARLSAVDAWDDTFLSRDPRKGTSLIAPRGRSPVLFGLRTATMEAAERDACSKVKPLKNQGVAGVRNESRRRSGRPSRSPLFVWSLTESKSTLPGNMQRSFWQRVRIQPVPTPRGPVNALARWLEPGDNIAVLGLTDANGVIHAERLKVEHCVPRAHQRPRCPTCDVRMKVWAPSKDFAARRVSTAQKTVGKRLCHSPHESWVEPPPGSRRHLARPLAWEDAF